MDHINRHAALPLLYVYRVFVVHSSDTVTVHRSQSTDTRPTDSTVTSPDNNTTPLRTSAPSCTSQVQRTRQHTAWQSLDRRATPVDTPPLATTPDRADGIMRRAPDARNVHCHLRPANLSPLELAQEYSTTGLQPASSLGLAWTHVPCARAPWWLCLLSGRTGCSSGLVVSGMCGDGKERHCSTHRLRGA